MPRRTKEDALATRDLILDTAERVFQLRGVSRTSLQEIALAAGLTRGAIYWHFQNKGDIFNAMMERVTLPMEATFKGQQAEVLPLDQVRECVRNAFHKTVHDPQVQRVFEIAIHKVEYVDELSMVRARHIEERNECVADMERLMAQAIAQKQVDSRTSASAAAVGLHALIGGLLQNWLLDPQAFDLEAVGAQTLEVYLAGLAVSKS